jgi:hypothetical protein
MRELTEHQVNPANDTLSITVEDAPGAGGAQHRYVISGFDNTKNFSKFTVDEPTDKVVILFQNGPIAEVGVNGVTHEALLAIVADRLRSFQAGPYANEHNAQALDNIEDAQKALQARTRERMDRGVEGTHSL